MFNLEILKEIVGGLAEIDYYTNHGPKAREYEEVLSKLIGKDAVAVTSLFVAAAMIGVEFGSKGMTGLRDKRIVEGVGIASNRLNSADSPFGRSFDRPLLEFDFSLITKLESDAIYDSVVFILNPFENLELLRLCVSNSFCSIISHEQGEMIDTYTGASILSKDAEFVERMRNIRSSYGANRVVTVPVTSNGRFSEVQAMLGLNGLTFLNAG